MKAKQTINSNIFTNLLLVDENGKPVKRTRDEYPYNYDGYVTWRGGENSEMKCTAYSDRLHQEDSKKYDKLCMKHFGNKSQFFSGREPKQIESFLQDWLNDKSVKLILIMEYCNKSSGNPYWRFEYNQSKN